MRVKQVTQGEEAVSWRASATAHRDGGPVVT